MKIEKWSRKGRKRERERIKVVYMRAIFRNVTKDRTNQ